jgi:hypothetical protein
MTLPATRQPQSLYRHLYLQVLAAIILGVLVGHFFPATGASGVDRFMSEARALTNLIGNGVATVVVARWGAGARYGAHARGAEWPRLHCQAGCPHGAGIIQLTPIDLTPLRKRFLASQFTVPDFGKPQKEQAGRGAVKCRLRS